MKYRLQKLLLILVKEKMKIKEKYLHNLSSSKLRNHMSIEPSPFLPQTTIAIEKVKIAAKAAHPI